MVLAHRRTIRAMCFRIVKLLLTLRTHSGTDPVRRSAACQGRRHQLRALGGTVCKQRKPQPVHIAQTGTHTQIWGGLISCVGQLFFYFFFSHFFFSLSRLLSCVFPSFFLSFAPSEKRSVLKHVLNITIFTFSCFKKAAKGGSVWCVFFFFFLVERSGSRVRLCLKL